jgi:D-inositol-3-phosphate glycosyltransferase
MRVLFLTDDPQLGGVSRSVDDLAARLGGGSTAQVLPVATAWHLPPRLAGDVAVIDFTLSWAKLPFLAALRAQRRRPRIVVVEHSYTASFEACCVAARRRFRAMLRAGYALADRVVAVSAGQADWMRAAGLVAPARLRAIPQAIDTDALARLKLPCRDPGAPLRLAAFGRYAPQKGFDTLIAAMRAVPPHVATLDLAGYGPLEGELRRLAEGLSHVRIAGRQDGPAALLGRCDAVVVPSRWEAFGLAGLEARAAGRPVIAAAVDGLVEQLAPAWGTLVPPDDPAALAAAIHALAGRDVAAMGAAARATAEGAQARKIAAWRRLLGELAA